MKRISVFALTLLLIASLIGIVTVSADTQKGVTAV